MIKMPEGTQAHAYKEFKIGLVIPIIHTKYVFDTVDRIFATNCRDDLVLCIVNDGNPEVADTLATHKFQTQVEILNLPANRCFSGANNAGWRFLLEKYPSLEYLGSINDDTVPEPSWLNYLLDCLKAYPKTALAQSVMKSKGWIGPKRAATWKLLGSDDIVLDKRNIKQDTFVPVICGFCFLGRRDALEQVNYFDEEFENGCEDVDLCLKLTVAGWRLVVACKSFVFHYEAASRYLPGTRTNLKKNHGLLAKKWAGNLERFNVVQPMTIAYCTAYNQEHFMEAWVRNAAQYADRILVMYARVPWTYNKKAREILQPDRTGEILERLKKEFSKLSVVEGNWETDTGTRNEALRTAKDMGAGWLLIVDTDEFYDPEEVLNAYEWMLKNPTEFWWMRHIQFIKRIAWTIIADEWELPKFQFCLDLSKVKAFKRMRIPQSETSLVIPDDICKCYHFSYLMPEAKFKQKLTTWGHAMEVVPNWYDEVWPRIKPGIRNFHPVNPTAWKEIKEISLPENIRKVLKELGILDVVAS